MILQIVAIVVGAGCLGGLVNGLLSERIPLPKIDGDCLKPGILGNVLIGGMASLIFWGIYGSGALVPIIGPSTAASVVEEPTLRMGELCVLLLVGTGGGRLLTTELRNRCLGNGAQYFTGPVPQGEPEDQNESQEDPSGERPCP